MKNINLTNLSQAGAGNTYIHDTTIAELSNRQYDFVAIMWTYPVRIDIKVSDINLFNGTMATSKFQSSRNDWKDKVVYPVNDQDFVEKDWVFGSPHYVQDKVLSKSKLFDRLYYYQDIKQLIYKSMINIISLQNTLKFLKVSYLFTYDTDYTSDFQTFPNLYKMFDQSCIYNTEHILSIAENNNWMEEDNRHPNIQAHKEWANLIQPLIQ